nr:glycosyltransferase family 4 protein [Caulobacter sp. 17J65-9]
MSRHRPPLSILHVLLHAGFGGAGTYCLDLALRQREAGHRVGFVVRPIEAEGGPSIHDYLPGHIPRYLAARPFEPFSIGGAVARFKPDILHAHVGRSARAVGAMWRRPPAVTSLHNRYRAKESARLDGVIRIAEWQRQDMAGYAGQTETISNWLPQRADVRPGEVEAARRRVGARPDDLLVGCVGRLHRVKGVDLLVEAFRAEAPAHARLALVGDGPERAALEALSAGDPRISFVGHVADPAPWYRALDLFVMPSRIEPFGISALEAMAAGAPILGTDAGGLGDILRRTAAVVVRADDRAALQGALAELIRARPGRVPYDLQAYQGHAAAERIERFYRSVIDEMKRQAGAETA